MLRKSTRPIASKQALMADYGSLPSPTENYRRPPSPFFSSPRIFTAFVSKGFSDTESLISPTSILDSKLSSGITSPLWSDASPPKTPKEKVQKLDARGVGLGILDALAEEKSDPKLSKPQSPDVLFGSKLKIEIPPLVLPFNVDSPRSPGDFGNKTRNSHVGSFSSSLSPSPAKKSGLEKLNSPGIVRVLSISEMELSEDYTCVISHGPNPKTTHIFDDCVVESCYGGLGLSSMNENEKGCPIAPSVSYSSDNFLSSCYNCKKHLGQGRDIFIYRGEKAFCSSECRQKEMMMEDGTEVMESDDMYGTFS